MKFHEFNKTILFPYCSENGWECYMETGGDHIFDQIMKFTHKDGRTFTSRLVYLWERYLRGHELDEIFSEEASSGKNIYDKFFGRGI